MRTDAETIEAVLNGKRADYAQLVRRYERVVHAVAVSILRDHHAAEDICQDAFLVAYRRLGTLRERASFGSWIVQIARNQALNRVRLRHAEQRLDESSEPVVRDGRIMLDSDNERLMVAVLELPDRERTAVLLRYFAGHSLEEISAITGQRAGTVGVQLHRARAHLRHMLEEVKP